jgi:hypothetical protein
MYECDEMKVIPTLYLPDALTAAASAESGLGDGRENWRRARSADDRHLKRVMRCRGVRLLCNRIRLQMTKGRTALSELSLELFWPK